MEVAIMNDLKKVLLAGIGLTAMTVDKADSFVKELVEKGRLTVEEGKELEQELKRQSKEEAQEFLNKLDAKKSSVEYATKEDVKRLEEKLDALLSHNK
jgi:polyhydroxyalkanoate synthesis regulator phasin